MFFGTKTFIKNTTEKIDKLMEVKLKNYGLPMDTGYHPEFGGTDMLFGTDITMHQILIVYFRWEISLVRYYVHIQLII